MMSLNLQEFCSRNPDCKERFERYMNRTDLSNDQNEMLLKELCDTLSFPNLVKDVVECFPEFLPALLSIVVSDKYSRQLCSLDGDIIHKRKCVILGNVVDINPELVIFAIRYFDINPSPFESVDEVFDTSSKRQKVQPSNISEVRDHDIVVATYNILLAATTHFRRKWNWSKFYKYLLSDDENTKWMALKCIGMVLGMSESSRLSYAQSSIDNADKFLTVYKQNYLNFFSSLDKKKIDDVVTNLSFTTSVGNVLLPVLKNVENNRGTHDLVKIPSVEKNLQCLAIALTSKKCICVQGLVGCGKTILIEHLAKVTGHDTSNFIKVQLSDQTDSKMLLGMYRCTDIPGEFVWQPGVLTDAVTAGKWLLLEDINSAASDVASVLSNLLETGILSVPGYRDTIYVNSGFKLFVTERLMISQSFARKQVSAAASLLQKHWSCINITALSVEELITVIETLFPILSTIAMQMIRILFLFLTAENTDTVTHLNAPLKFGRPISTRDLIKWCSRAIIDFDVSSPDSALKIFQDAIDVFCCSVSDQEQRLNFIKAIAAKLGIVVTMAEYYSKIYKPTVSLLPGLFLVGRAKLPRKKSQYAALTQTKINFSFTRSSACLLERITNCVALKEPVLLVGETGTGKTSTVQYLAHITGHKLIVINMNQQSESADLLGGYKPVDLKFLITPIIEEFEILFRSFFAVEPNKKFLEHIALCHKQQKWRTLITSMSHSSYAALKRLRMKKLEVHETLVRGKRRSSCEKNEDDSADVKQDLSMLRKWEKIAEKIDKLELQVKAQHSLVFSFIEGSLVKALRQGHWILLDEINLANTETLDCLLGLLERSSGSLSLLERGDTELIDRHPDFTIFACMNPATDVGKKDLPVGLRNRFTEFYVDELSEQLDLQLLVNTYLEEMSLSAKHQEAIVKFYLNIRKEATNTLLDGTGHKPHYSLRTLCRALNISASNPCGNIVRSLYEAFSLSFLTQLDYKSYAIVLKMISRTFISDKSARAFFRQPIPKPKCFSDEDCILYFEEYWLSRGTLQPDVPNNYILTNSVKRNLKDLVRIVSIGKIPILLQGDTSVGKTSLITYLAKATGHVCVRINNHEHTDLQEYVGSYLVDETGNLAFKEGILVEAMRKGYWIILDELNLAPSDVLEALNRVLDDNRELFIPETQQVVKAHNNFMLFATQNPPGLYGGRKVLSRAFRNRFVELHFNEIPTTELQIILHERCQMPKSYCKQVIDVMTDLQIRRKSTAAFAGKQGFITLRDLFRWGERYRLAPDVGNKLYDWSQHLADEGYLVLAAKVRKAEEDKEIREVIKKHLRRDVDPNTLFSLNDHTSTVTKNILEQILNSSNEDFKHVVWTYPMRRMAVLVKKSCQFKEPILLVGETGCGKTTICQLIAAINGQTMRSVNCHMHSESSDFLGNLRPVREFSSSDNQRFFEWVDGPLIIAMNDGDLFLADEISLADDSVLERLNSLLEPERSLLLAEKGADLISDQKNGSVIVADDKFVFIGTMNPGGDYGKKELSPALRNRFTEIWCETCTARNDLNDIIVHNIHENLQAHKESIAAAILNFIEWLPTTDIGKKFTVSIRDVLTWVCFINTCTCDETILKLNIGDAYYHGACLTYIDSLGSGLTGSETLGVLEDFKSAALTYITNQVKDILNSELSNDELIENNEIISNVVKDTFGIAPFYILKDSRNLHEDVNFTFSTPTTKSNTLKLLRALQLHKPILLEGSPGVGKTSTVSAIAKASGHVLQRINLSDQTDVSDLFGTDLPVEGGQGGEFAWKDGPFLQALRAGHWILLDELNLASQSVLEGLNACFDHREEVYVPELGKTFTVKSGTKLFACQNPLKQGGGRKGLPKSFLNRFTQVFIDALNEDDITCILNKQFPELPVDLIRNMTNFNTKLSSEVGVNWGHDGSPWEMNLRDITRWCEVTVNARCNDFDYNPGNSVELIYVNRMRTDLDKETVRDIYEKMFSREKYPLSSVAQNTYITEEYFCIDDVMLPRKYSTYIESDLLLLRNNRAALKSILHCVNMNWMPILVGAIGTGKASLVRLAASLTGQKLKCIAVHSAMDTTEILGGFEQTDYNRHFEQLLEQTENLLLENFRAKIHTTDLKEIAKFHGYLENVRHLSNDESNARQTMTTETQLFLRKCKNLLELVSAMKTFEPSCESELQEIETKLKSLSTLVEKEKCLNAGGKFEWQDSVLVKCLRDGTWLLITQVNLCSPAVLDRLNGLLEPNGVLTIGERGVDSEGKVVTVRPHKNFRLFLTMDPRYGEISRAMRNRGVEIFLQASYFRQFNHEMVIDGRSILFNTGVTKRAHQDLLLDAFFSVAKTLGSCWPNFAELKHSGLLTVQRLARGFEPNQAIRNACIDIYVKSLPATMDHYAIDDVIDRIINLDDSKFSFDLNATTWTIRNLQDNSKLTVIRQQGFLLSSAIEIVKTHVNICEAAIPTTACFRDLVVDFPPLIDDELKLEIPDILAYLLLDFYEQSSRADLKIRLEWLAEKLRNDDTFKDLAKKNVSLAEEVASFDSRSKNDKLPCDRSRLPRILINSKNPDVMHDANQLGLILYLRTMIIRDDTLLEGTLPRNNKNVMTIKEYSNAVYNDKLTANLKKQPILINFVELITKSNACIDAVLKDSNFRIDTKMYVELRQNLKWCNRFHELGDLLVKSKKIKGKYVIIDLKEIALQLRVHYKWLIKFLERLYSTCDGLVLSESSRNEMKILSAIIDRINNTLFSKVDLFKKISSKIRKYLTLPLPHISEESMEMYSKLTKFSKMLQPLNPDSINQSLDRLKREMQIILTVSDYAATKRHSLLLMYYEVYLDKLPYSDVTLDTITADDWNNNYYFPKMLFTSSNLTNKENLDYISDIIESPTVYSKIIVLPIYEYLFLTLAYFLHRKIVQDPVASMYISQEHIKKFLDFPSIPINLLAILKALSKEVTDTGKKELLLSELCFLLTTFSERNCAMNDPNFYLHWNGITEEDTDTSIISNVVNEKNQFTGGPLLFNFIMNLIFSTTKEKGVRLDGLALNTLKRYRSRVYRLKILCNDLWNTSIALTSRDYDFSYNDFITLKFYLNLYVSAIDRMHSEHDINSLIATTIDKQKDYKRDELRNKFRCDYIEPIYELREMRKKFESDSEENCDDALNRGKTWILLGYLQILLFGNLGYIDRVDKIKLELKYLNEDIADWKRAIYVYTLQSYILKTSFHDEHTHPRYFEIKNHLELLLKQRDSLKQFKAFRPISSNFRLLKQESENFNRTINSYKKICKQIGRLTIVKMKLSADYSIDTLTIAEKTLREIKMWYLSVQRFSERMEIKFLPAYPDIVLPLLSALAHLKHGISILTKELKKLISSAKLRLADGSNVETLIYNLGRYPTLGLGQENLMNLIDTCTSKGTKDLIGRIICTTSDSVKQQFDMVKCGLYELYNCVVLEKNISKTQWVKLNELLRQVVLMWKQRQQEAEKQAAEKESLYKNTAKTHGDVLTEAEEISLELDHLFPTYDKDFDDLRDFVEPNAQSNVPCIELNKTHCDVISNNDFVEVQEIHSVIINAFVTSKWLSHDFVDLMPNYVKPITLRYRLISLLLNDTLPSLSDDLTSKLYNGMHFMLVNALQTTQNNDEFKTVYDNTKVKNKKIYDYYRDPNIEEVKKCIPLCEPILEKVCELLQQDEDPILKSMKVLLERIISFPITSPISRFSTGLELFLHKVNEWNSPTKLTLSSILSPLTTQLSSWKKFEFVCWKNYPDTIIKNLQSHASKWWFFLYALIESYMTQSVLPTIENLTEIGHNKENSEIINKEKLIESLKIFMNESSLVEFLPRFKLILTFCCHVLHFDSSSRKEELLAILWNILNYYRQFSTDINNKIYDLKASFAQSLKDFIQIRLGLCRANYEMVRNNIHKIYKELHKLIKNFQNELKQSISSCLIIKGRSCNMEVNTNTKDDHDQIKYVINPNDFTVSKRTNINDSDILLTKSNFPLKAETTLNKAKNICTNIILQSFYPSIRLDIEDFIQNFVDQSIRLKGVEIDKTLPKDKQKSQAKSILQQKKLALADYFKILNSMGVSYRTGILTWRNHVDKVINFSIAPLNLSVIAKYFKLENIDEQMLVQWTGCEKYYYQSLIKLNALDAMFKVSQTDIGIQNVERCRGYSAHIMLLAHKQKNTLAKLFNHYMPFRMKISDLADNDTKELDVPKQSLFQYCVQDLKELMTNLELGFGQILLYLLSCTTTSAMEIDDKSFVLDSDMLPISIHDIAKSEDDSESAIFLLKECLNITRTTKARFNSAFISMKMELMADDRPCNWHFLNSNHFNTLEHSYAAIDGLLAHIHKLINIFSTANHSHPLVENIAFLKMKIIRGLGTFKKLKESKNYHEEELEESNDFIKRYESNMENLIHHILIIIQKKYKTIPSEVPCTDTVGDDNVVEDDFEKNKLKEKLIDYLEKDIEELMLEKTSQLFNNLLFEIQEFDQKSINYCKRLLLRHLPILEQYILLVQFYLNEQVASFRVTCKLLYLQLNTFLNLAENGFCIPKDLDLDEDNKNESQKNNSTGGMGLGEGEGEKDVSDRIENEDQLEDAKRADQEEEKIEDQNCKEEEKGIDMSENFDSKLQDVERDENDDEEDNKDEDEDLDKEMGETEENADQLDKEMWGDDEDEAEDDDQPKDTEEQGRGEQCGDKELTAKNDESKNNYSDDDTDDRQNERKDERKEIDEINEPETNDDQIDPYHGKNQPQPEPEPFDLPEDMNLDEDEMKEDDCIDEKDPFDIDDMKESKPPPEKMQENPETRKEEEEKSADPDDDDSSEEDGNEKSEERENQESTEKEDKNSESNDNQAEKKNETENENEADKDENTEEKEKEEEKVAPSTDDASKQLDAAEQIDDVKDGSRDKSIQQSQMKDSETPSSTENDQDNGDDQGVGQSKAEQRESGHAGSSAQDNVASSRQEEVSEQPKKRKNPGTADENRSLLNEVEPKTKKLKMVYNQEEALEENKEGDSESKDRDMADMCEHIKNSEKFDDFSMDAATEDQAKQQASNIEDKDDLLPTCVEANEEEEEEENDDVVPKRNPEKLTQNEKKKSTNDNLQKGDGIEDINMETTTQIEGDLMITERVERGNETTFHTKVTDLENDCSTSKSTQITRFDVEEMLSEWMHRVPLTEEATKAWNCLSMLTDTAARDLSEKLRLILEPTQASRLKGDYRTGRRLNMRKIIPYIASQFRKDKIWLRRTKPSKRDYQIVLALDDSSSMADNHSKELAFESVSLISQAMTYLEAGQLCVISFGERVRVLHPLSERFTKDSGSSLIQEMKFEEKKTMVGELVNFTVDMFETQTSSVDNARLVIIISDGRGIFSEGMEKINQAARRAKMVNIFLVFIIVDNPINKDSILDIRMPIFEDGKFLGIGSYMDDFPFPFYMILRDINMLPNVLSDALRQWFEVIGKIDV